MNNIFFNQPDPLLSNLTAYKLPDNNNIQNNQYLYQQLADYANKVTPKDWLGELDNLSKGLDNEVINNLTNNHEYMNLSMSLQSAIQIEVVNMVKSSINTNPEFINNIKRQMEIINETKNANTIEQRKNLSELNDYMKNYSHLTFDQYKHLKNGEPIDETTDNMDKPKKSSKSKK